jgi:hypothetical protein
VTTRAGGVVFTGLIVAVMFWVIVAGNVTGVALPMRTAVEFVVLLLSAETDIIIPTIMKERINSERILFIVGSP